MTIPHNKKQYDKLLSHQRPSGKYMLEQLGYKINYLYNKIQIIGDKNIFVNKTIDNNDLLVKIYYKLIKTKKNYV